MTRIGRRRWVRGAALLPLLPTRRGRRQLAVWKPPFDDVEAASGLTMPAPAIIDIPAREF